MGFRFQRRLNLGSGLGLNLGKTGASVSGRTFFGSIGTGGFSVRSGFPGFGYRKPFGRGVAGLLVGLVVLGVMVVVNLVLLLIIVGASVALVLFQLLWCAALVSVKLLVWATLTVADFARYMLERSRPAPESCPIDDPSASPQTLPVLPVHGRPRMSKAPRKRG